MTCTIPGLSIGGDSLFVKLNSLRTNFISLPHLTGEKALGTGALLAEVDELTTDMTVGALRLAGGVRQEEPTFHFLRNRDIYCNET